MSRQSVLIKPSESSVEFAPVQWGQFGGQRSPMEFIGDQDAEETYWPMSESNVLEVYASQTALVLEAVNKRFEVTTEAVKQAFDRMRFSHLAGTWKSETLFLSSSTELVMSHAYQSIIGMGDRAVPFIFEELRKEGEQPKDWFWALVAILGFDPIPDDFVGNRRALAKVWLQWAEQHGYGG